MMKQTKNWLIISLISLSLIWALTVLAQENPQKLALLSPGVACTEEYNPVCGVDNYTYPNPCTAMVAGVKIKHQGPCQTPKPSFSPLPQPLPSRTCYLLDSLVKSYQHLLLELRKAEQTGDKEQLTSLLKRIAELNEEMKKAKMKCISPVISSPSTAVDIPWTMDYCDEAKRWENKVSYYQRLASSTEAELKQQTDLDREEINQILTRLPLILTKLKTGCAEQQKAKQNQKPLPSTQSPMRILIEPIKPIAVETEEEIVNYYKARIETITATGSPETQIEELKSLRAEIGKLITQLAKNKKEIHLAKLEPLITELKIKKGRLNFDEVEIETKDKKVIVSFEGNILGIKPTEQGVTVQDKNLEITAPELSLKDGSLYLGSSVIKHLASEIAERFKISPVGTELKEVNNQPIYRFKLWEPRKIFGFIPLTITRIITADASSGMILKEQNPWYLFLTTRPK